MRYLLVLTLLLTSCAAQHPIHPGAVNQFDSTTYDSLLVTHSVIETTKSDLTSGAFTSTLVPKIKTALNALITAYDTADKLYVDYHQALVAGNATPAQATAVANSMQSVSNATTALSTAKGAK